MRDRKEAPVASVIIPHYCGKEILLRCLHSLYADDSISIEVILVDNASTDDSVRAAVEAFPQIKVLRSKKNMGYAGGCNLGMQAAGAAYLVLLNNDAIVSPGALAKLLRVAQANPEIAAIQPKIKSISKENYFDYAGAAGGFIDIFGFPFARGRIFFTMEEDLGQYDTAGEIFWASGTCTLLRGSAVGRVGYLDESFFAHMEEIDLNWRMHLAGYRVWYAPEAVVLHNAGTTLRPETPRKIFLNHRNSLVMMLKNYSLLTLVWVFPIRLAFEIIAIFYVLLKGDFPQAKAILKGCFAAFAALPSSLKMRRAVQKIRLLTDAQIMGRMFKRSVVFQYFLRNRKTFEKLKIERQG
ncbi:MAG: glycosyltransferase family 2 protein [bacterium]